MAILSYHLPALRSLAVPSICLLICFLAYSSQYLFHFLEPGPLSTKEAIWFNLAVLGTWLSYERACRVDPGRLPKALANTILKTQRKDAEEKRSGPTTLARIGQVRWCKKCQTVKPPRAHHCKQCGRCIPKMDHHCPWTSNCASHTTFPHFLRFVYYTCASLSVLAHHLYGRLYAVYAARNLPSYLGPPTWALVHLLILTFTTGLLLFALTILLVTATQSLLINTTMIESWEKERHEALVEKSRYLGGWVHGPGGSRYRIQKQEFPYDIGIWKNLVQGMGTSNVIAWLLPFGGAPSNETGWGPWEENGFEDEGTLWPPVDPDKLPRLPANSPPDQNSSDGFIREEEDEIQAFRRRQQEDYKRWETMRNGNPKAGLRLRSSEKAAATPSPESSEADEDEDYESEYEEGLDGEEGWTNSDGDRLRDYGVDEEAELLVDEDIPLGELLRRRRGKALEED